MNILTIIGTRPEIIKMFPVIKEIDKKFKQTLVWSGQHFSKNMVGDIFEDVKLRKPDLFINENFNEKNKFFKMQYSIYKIILKLKPSAIIFHGDTLTTLGSNLVPWIYFSNIKKIHIEGGYRSYDRDQIEERIRYMTDHMSDMIFVPRSEDKVNLIKEGIKKNIYVVGNSINDSISHILKNNKITLNNNYILCTLHRQENVNNKIRLNKIIKILNFASNHINIIFSVHPRTLKILKSNQIKLNKKIILKKPMKYSELINYIKHCQFVISDSGGIQEESVYLKKRCLVPLNFTPHSYYLGENSNILLDLSISQFKKILKKLISEKKYKSNFFHQSNVSKKIVKILEDKLR